MTQTSPTDGPSSRLKWLLLPFGLLAFALVLPIFGCIYIFAESGRRGRAWRLRIAMRNARRISSWAKVEADLCSGAGTLIVDGPYMGWNDSDIWWTRESVTTLAASEGIALPTSEFGALDRDAFDARMKDPVFDRWCHARYFDVSGGTAKLVQCTHWYRDVGKLRKRIEKLRSAFPRLECVYTNTWMVAELQFREREQAQRDIAVRRARPQQP